MALVKTLEPQPVPHEMGHSFTFRTLSGSEIDEAKDAQMKTSLQMFNAIDVDLSKLGSADPNAQVDLMSQYDKDVLIRYGVVAWTYGEPCDAESKAKLDALTRDWAARVILEENVRPPVSGETSEPAI